MRNARTTRGNDGLRLAGYAAPVMLAGVVYALAFYPAIMTYDSLYQWQQLVTQRFDDWHPILSTLLMGALRPVWESPAAAVLLQVAALGLAAGWGFALMESLGAPRPLVWGACLLLAASPVTGMLTVTLWKDIPYGIALLAVTLAVARVVISDGRWLDTRLHAWGLGLLLAACLLLRHNGAAAALGTPLVLAAAYPRQRWALLQVVLAGSLLAATVAGPMSWALKVRPRTQVSLGDGFQLRFFAVTAHVAAHVAAGTPLRDAERDYLGTLKPLDPPWFYRASCDDATLRLNQFDWGPVLRHPGGLWRCGVALAWRRPGITLRHVLDHSALVWTWRQPPGTVHAALYRAPGCTPAVIYIKPKGLVPGLEQAPLWPQLTEWLAGWVFRLQDKAWPIWQSAIYLYLVVAGTTWAALRSHAPRVWLVAAPLLFHSILLVFVMTAPQSRFQYPAYLVAHVFWPGLLAGRFPAAAERENSP